MEDSPLRVEGSSGEPKGQLQNWGKVKCFCRKKKLTVSYSGFVTTPASTVTGLN
ncbi:hypothetical protein STEG23_022041, partial [Scotinomys teguina]